MKHIKIFEDFSGFGGAGMGMRPGFGGASKYLIGYFATGGYGAHPGIVTEDDLESNGWSESGSGSGSWSCDGGLMFQVTSQSTEIPQALLCIGSDESGDWKIDPITKQKADAIYNVGGTPDYIFDDFDTDAPVHGEMGEIKRIAGISGQEGITTINVIQHIEPNMIYWSDNPEQSHGYWESENSRPMSVEEFTSENSY
jgi:hypothetical protein